MCESSVNSSYTLLLKQKVQRVSHQSQFHNNSVAFQITCFASLILCTCHQICKIWMQTIVFWGYFEETVDWCCSGS